MRLEGWGGAHSAVIPAQAGNQYAAAEREGMGYRIPGLPPIKSGVARDDRRIIYSYSALPFIPSWTIVLSIPPHCEGCLISVSRRGAGSGGRTRASEMRR